MRDPILSNMNTKQCKENLDHLRSEEDANFLTHLSFQLAELDAGEDSVPLLLHSIKEHTKAVFSSYTDYDKERNALIVRKTEMDGNLYKLISKVGGEKLLNTVSLLDEQSYNRILNEPVGIYNSLTELTHGGVSHLVDRAIKQLTSYVRFYKIAHVLSGKLYGSTVLGFKKHQPLPSNEFLKSFAYLAALALRRKIAESALLESETKFRQITNNLMDVVYTADLKMNITFVSPSVQKLTGESPEQFLQRTIHEIHPPETIKKFLHTLEEEIKNESVPGINKNRSRILEGEQYRADGSLVQISEHVSFLRDDTGKAIGLIGVTRDITERKKAEARMTRLTQCMLNFGNDKNANINSLVALCGESFDAVCSLYNRLDSGMLCSIGKWNTPDDYISVDKPDGHICYDVIQNAGQDILHIGNLDQTPYFESDPNVKAYNLKTYLGIPVLCNEQAVGSLCLVYQSSFSPTANDLDFFKLISYAISNEEERKLDELELNKSNQLLREIADNMFDPVVLTNTDGRIIFSTKAIQLLGYNREDFVGEYIQDFIHPDDLPLVASKVKSIIESGEVDHFEAQYRCADGNYAWIEFIGKMLMTPGKDQAQLLFCGRITTERKESELKLKESEEKYRLLAENAMDVIWTMDINGKYLYISPSVIKNRNFTFEEIQNQTFEEALTPESARFANLLLEETRKTIASGKKPTPESIILEQYCRDGSTVWTEIMISAVYDENDQFLHFLGVTRDITTRKKAEDELVHAKERAEESNRLKSAFLANVSHEIRTPMNGILGFLDLLRNMDINGEEQHKYIEIVNKSGQRLLNTINDIIEISRIESGQLQVNPEKTDVYEIMHFFFDFFKKETADKNISLRIGQEIKGNQAVMIVDKHKLDCILTNLIKNAIKFTHQGYIEIGNYIQGNNVVFYVKDSGIGIPSEQLPIIFDRFVQANMENKPQQDGSGLGLAIVKAYVEMQNGQVWVDSVLGEGTTFSFSLPYLAQIPHPAQTEAVISGSDDIPDNVSILLAEDDEISYLYLERILNKEGVTLFHAWNGLETVNMLRENPAVSLVLMDIRMPGMNGLDATRKIRTFNPDVPIIAQTAYALTGDREIAIEAGCTDYITKPLNREDLLLLIRKYTST